MASCSGNSSDSMQLQNSGSEENLRILMDQRKRKRKELNRESAKRSRMRKQKHIDDLTLQKSELMKENKQILTSTNMAIEQLLNVEAENSILRAQMVELSQRLESLNDIISYLNTNTGGFEIMDDVYDNSFINHPWNLIYVNQEPIMASADMFYY